MTEDELFDALEGLFAYDTGCVSSGIHDEVLKMEAIAALFDMGEDAMKFISARLRDAYMTDDAIKKGYGIESVVSFVRWLGDNGYDV